MDVATFCRHGRLKHFWFRCIFYTNADAALPEKILRKISLRLVLHAYIFEQSRDSPSRRYVSNGSIRNFACKIQCKSVG